MSKMCKRHAGKNEDCPACTFPDLMLKYKDYMCEPLTPIEEIRYKLHFKASPREDSDAEQ